MSPPAVRQCTRGESDRDDGEDPLGNVAHQEPNAERSEHRGKQRADGAVGGAEGARNCTAPIQLYATKGTQVLY